MRLLGRLERRKVQKVVFELIEDPTVTQRMIESGEADFTYQLPPTTGCHRQNPNLVFTRTGLPKPGGLFNTVKPRWTTNWCARPCLTPSL
jgi:hypothetical protein